MVKVIGIIEDNPITGVKYGTIEVNEHTSEIQRAKYAYDSAVAKVKLSQAKKIRSKKIKNK